jgi:UDP-glucose 4-epimerase
VTRRVTGKTVEYTIEERRAGDPLTLVADSTFASEVLKWKPVLVDIDRIIETACRFHHQAGLT